MSSILKKESAMNSAFKHNPKSIHTETTKVAKDFVTLQAREVSDFQIATIVSEQSGVRALQKKNIDAQVEETVLDRLKEIEEKAYKQAYDLGLIEGTEKAFEEKKADLQAKLNDLDESLKSLEVLKKKFYNENENFIIHLVYHVAKKIALREVSLSQEPVVKMLTDLVEEVQGADTINVRLNPENMKFIEELRSKKIKEVENLERVKLISDPALTKGGCVIETNYGSIVNTVEQRVEKAWNLLQAKMPSVNDSGD